MPSKPEHGRPIFDLEGRRPDDPLRGHKNDVLGALFQ